MRVLGLSMIAFSSLAPLSACADWSNESAVVSVAWSDDDTEIAYAVQRFQKRPGAPTPEVDRNFRVQLYIGHPDRPDSSPVGREFPGAMDDRTLRDMRRTGYFTLAVHVADQLQFLQILRDGTVRTIATVLAPVGRPCETANTEVIPSPTGRYLALFGTTSCQTDPSGAAVAGPLRAVVHLVDAVTLATIRVDTMAFATANDVVRTWMPGGGFVVASVTAGWSFDVDRLPRSVSRPRCSEPPTTSSDRSATGVLAVWTGRAVSTGLRDSTRAFGCQ